MPNPADLRSHALEHAAFAHMRSIEAPGEPPPIAEAAHGIVEAIVYVGDEIRLLRLAVEGFDAQTRRGLAVASDELQKMEAEHG